MNDPFLDILMTVYGWEKEFCQSSGCRIPGTPERMLSVGSQNPGDPETSLQRYSRSCMPDQKRSSISSVEFFINFLAYYKLNKLTLNLKKKVVSCMSY
jgi:hypothetical protein